MARHVREFGQGLKESHDGTDSLLKGLADAYEGASCAAAAEGCGGPVAEA
ncbi:hypothetical protein ACIGT4_14280 [Streptomyces sioyaensis]